MGFSLKIKKTCWLAGLAGVALMLCACSARKTAADPATLIKAGWNNYTLSEYDRAEADFEAALAAAPAGSEARAQALYGLATTVNLRRPGEDPERARKLYAEILDQYPRHDLAAWSLLGLARMQHLVPVGAEPDYPAVKKAYQDVMPRFPGHLAAEEAFIYYNSILIQTLQEADTRQAISNLLAAVQNPSNRFIGPAWSLLAVGYQTLGMPEQRLECELKSFDTTEVDPSNPFTEFAWQYWNIATIAEFEVGDFETARKFYNKLIAEYPRDIRIYGARQALKRMDELEAKIKAGG